MVRVNIYSMNAVYSTVHQVMQIQLQCEIKFGYSLYHFMCKISQLVKIPCFLEHSICNIIKIKFAHAICLQDNT
jgi:hypothetical protein